MAAIMVRMSAQGVTERVLKPLSKVGIKSVREGATLVKSLENALSVSGVDYTALMVMENNPYDVALFDVYERCGGGWRNIFEGEFNWFDVTVDRDKKHLSIKPKERSKRKCIESKWELDTLTLYDGSIQVVKPFNGVYEIKCCDEVTTTPTGQPIICAGVDDTLKWWVSENTFDDIGGGEWYHKTCWHRIKTTIPCVSGSPVPPPGDGWVLLSNNCPTDATYVREPIYDNLLGIMKNGRLLNTSLLNIFDEMGCGLTLRSNFLGINPSGDTPVNQAYIFAEAYLRELTIHQKSDIKRPLDSNPALPIAWSAKPKDIITDLINMMNLELKIIGDDARLEHVSYFEEGSIKNVSSFDKVNEYTHDNADSEQYEQYNFMDEMSSAYFKGKPISYTTGNGVKPVRLSKISTDIVFIQESGASDQAITDAGFCIISTKLSSGVRAVIDYNRALSWTKLHDNLFRWGRRFPAGNLNGVPVNFYSWKRRRKLPGFTLPFCCDSDWDFYSRVQDGVRIGEVSEAVYYPETGTAKIITTY